MPGPSAFEQQMLEQINRARANPAGEFAALIANQATLTGFDPGVTSALRAFKVDLALFRSQIAGLPALAPLAWNDALALAAERHNRTMIAQDAQSHQLPGELDLRGRVADVGYVGWTSLRENVFAYSKSPVQAHAGFFIDWGYGPGGMQSPAGHRNSILSDRVTEVGIDVTAEGNSGTKVGPFVVTQDFGGRRDAPDFLLGVVMDDRDGDRSYDMGEGMGGVTITANGAGGVVTTTSWTAGGYQMVLTPGNWVVTFSGGGLVGTVSRDVVMGTSNVKIDALADDAVVVAPVAAIRLAEIVMGTADDDVLIGSDGADDLFGGAGDDVLAGDGVDAVFDAAAAQVYGLYEATLGRAPSQAKLTFWVDQLLEGDMTAAQVAGALVASSEFRVTLGANTVTKFANVIYANVFGRGPDASSLAALRAEVASGASLGDIALRLAGDAAFTDRLEAAALGHGSSAQAGMWADDVFRLYRSAFDRAPTMDELKEMTSLVASSGDLTDAANALAATAEFQAEYGSMTNTQFVRSIYLDALDRPMSAAGVTSWVKSIASGASTRATFVEAIAQSATFVTSTNAAVEAFMRTSPDDRLDGGAGDNILVGGLGSDTFVFDRALGGTHRIADMEAWDSIELKGFGFATTTQAEARFVQSGDDAVMSYLGTTIILEDTSAAWLDKDMFVI